MPQEEASSVSSEGIGGLEHLTEGLRAGLLISSDSSKSCKISFKELSLPRAGSFKNSFKELSSPIKQLRYLSQSKGFEGLSSAQGHFVLHASAEREKI